MRWDRARLAFSSPKTMPRWRTLIMRALRREGYDADEVGSGGDRCGLRLRTIALLGGTTLAVLALLAAAASVVLTTLMRRGTETVQAANHTIRTAVEIHSALVAFGRESRLQDEQALARVLANARAQAPSAQDVRLVDNLEAKVYAYFDARKSAEATHDSLRDTMLAADATRQAALAASDAFVDAASNRAGSVETKVRVWDVTGTITGVIVGVLTLVGVPAVLLALHRLFSRPLLSLSAAIRDFAAGDHSARAPVEGAAEFTALAHSFNELADGLARQEEERLAFLGGVARDLRNPVSALRMTMHFVQPARALPPEAKLRGTFALVTRLDRMLGDFLDAVRIQRGELDLRIETHDARDLARNTVELYASASKQHALALSVPAHPVEIAADAMRIEQVLNNLVSNAIKYSPSGGHVAVTVTEIADEAVIAVADEGVGIGETDRARIFEAFRRTRGSREIAPGVGLGLAVARRIVEAHDGTIEVASTPHRGSTFLVHLPLLSRPDHKSDCVRQADTA